MLSAIDPRRQALPHAVRQGEIRPVFQPIVRLDNLALAGFEVLARWNSPDHGPVAPETFIPWAEEDGYINALTHELVASACAAAAGWGEHFFLCFNISPLQFNGRDLESVIFSAVAGTGFPHHRLVMEMTESSDVYDTRNAHEIIGRLKKAGVRLALDDFGTGYAGINRLLSFPFHALKIDRSFVRSIETDPSARTIMAAIIGLASSLGLEVVVEGIERQAQRDILLSLGCTYGQGWLLGIEMAPPDAACFAQRHLPARLPAPDPARPALPGSDDATDDAPSSSARNPAAARLDALFGLADIGLCQIGPDMRLMRANDAFAALFQKPEEALNGGAASDVLPSDLALWLCRHAAEIGASDDTFVFSLPRESGPARRLRVRRMVMGSAPAGLLLMAVPN